MEKISCNSKFFKRWLSLLTMPLLAAFLFLGSIPVFAQKGYDGLGDIVMQGGQRDLQWPVTGNHNIKSCFYDHREHYALDIAAVLGTNVVASYDGTVVETFTGGYGDGYGNFIVLKHNYKTTAETITLYTKYNHLNSVGVSVGQNVSKGQVIGKVGQTGAAEGPHLDFQCFLSSAYKVKKNSIDPYANQLLELPSDLIVTDSWDCGRSYFELIKQLYSTPVKPNYPPVISDVSVTDVSPSGYTIACTVVDDSGIDRVQFPTWTAANGQDDIDTSWTTSQASRGTQNGNRWSFRVNTSAHHSECGFYVTHIYAYDQNGISESWSSVIYIRSTDSKEEIGAEPLAQMYWNDHQYIVLKPTALGRDGLNWMEASAYCQSLGGYLVTITSAEENNRVTELLKQTEEPSGWIGMNDFGNEGHFVLENNETSSYSNWSEGEPNNLGGSQDAVAISRNGKWDDNSSVFHAFILEAENMCEHVYETESVAVNCLERPKTKKTCKKCGHEEIVETDPDWSEWTVGEPGEDLKGMKNRIETAVQYRTKGVRTVETEDGNLSGYISREPFTAYGNWSGWSGWSLDAVGANDLREVQTTALYRYYYFYCPRCGGHEPFTGTSDCHQYSLSQADAHEGWFPTAYSNSNSQAYSYTTAKKYTESLGDGQRWNFSAGNLNDHAIGTKDAGSDAIVIRTGYRSRTRTATQKYRYTFWEEEWSDWTTQPAQASSTLQVEKRNVYRVDHAEHGEHSWGEGHIVQKPTETHTGLKEYECQTCHSIRQEIIPQLEGKEDISHAQIVFDADSFEWTGQPVTPHFSVIVNNRMLVPEQDYTWSFVQNVDPGNAQVIVTGTGAYSGTCKNTFFIHRSQIEDKEDISNAQIVFDVDSFEWTGQPVTPHFSVILNDRTLVPEQDYTWSFVQNVDPGNAQVIVTGTGGYSGTCQSTFFINKPQIEEPDPVRTITMYRLYNPNSGEHFYTANLHEKGYLVQCGWNDEGEAWIAPETSDMPVYRLYNANAGDHHYTMNVREREVLIGLGWKDEGTGWYSASETGVPLYRQYNPNARVGSHNYTVSKKENDFLKSVGWLEEGIGWYGLR